jgi:hypothetical protein
MVGKLAVGDCGERVFLFSCLYSYVGLMFGILRRV